jgi:hypothetical protein
MIKPVSLLILLLFALPELQTRVKETVKLNQLCTYQTISPKKQAFAIDLRAVTQLPTSLYESSGIVVINENRIWSHEDSGNENILTCIDTTGSIIRTIEISNVPNIDWEDLATDDQNRIYINDAGNNDNNRTDLAIYRIPDPESISGNHVNAEIISFTFEDQTQFPPPQSDLNFDIEGIIWHDDSLFLFTKNRSIPQNGYCKMYKLPADPGDHTAILLDSVYLGNSNAMARVTAADIHHETKELILLTETRIISFTNYTGNSFFNGDMLEYVFTYAPGQTEGVAFITPYRLYISQEGTGGIPGFLYEIVLPTTGMPDSPTGLLEFNVFPNPARDILSIDSPFPTSALLELYDISGKRLYQSEMGSNHQIDISGFDPGVICIRLTTNNQLVTRKIVKL